MFFHPKVINLKNNHTFLPSVLKTANMFPFCCLLVAFLCPFLPLLFDKKCLGNKIIVSFTLLIEGVRAKYTAEIQTYLYLHFKGAGGHDIEILLLRFFFLFLFVLFDDLKSLWLLNKQQVLSSCFFCLLLFLVF